MPSMTDIFGSDAFGVVSLTNAIEILPAAPGKIVKLGIFKEEGIPTTTAVIDEREGTLSLVPDKPRGSPATQSKRDARRARSYAVPHAPLEDSVLADDVQGVREFGKEGLLAGPSTLVNQRLLQLKTMQEVTLEYQRAQALQGLVPHIDDEGIPSATPLHNLFTDYSITRSAVDFVLGTAGTLVRSKVVSVKRLINTALGSFATEGVIGLCGKDFWDAFIEHALVKAAFDRWQSGAFLRDDFRAQGFNFAGVTFYEYDAQVAGHYFVPPGECQFFPIGVLQMYLTKFAPAPWMETVNTIGRRMYAKQVPLDKLDSGRLIHVQMNSLNWVTRPAALVRGHTSN